MGATFGTRRGRSWERAGIHEPGFPGERARFGGSRGRNGESEGWRAPTAKYTPLEWVSFFLGPSLVQLVQVLGPLFGLPVGMGILNGMGIQVERSSEVRVAQLPLCHLWRSAGFEKQCCVRLSEGMEASARSADLIRRPQR